MRDSEAPWGWLAQAAWEMCSTEEREKRGSPDRFMEGRKKEPSHSLDQKRSVLFRPCYRYGAVGVPIYTLFSLLPLQESLITFHSYFTVSTGYNLLCALHHFLKVSSSFHFLISLICMKTRSLALEILSAQAANAAY